ncbi:hypothetical protein GH839_27865 [Bacillus thuringiensis]|nr:hypothetical protein [Bacillus thuringiensis]MRB43135.1 hypothetical protein [Bacillus thuringiensis]MRB49328.1 hypothetical protein [Bacillus thuringiensis]MRB55636.1 hypothetical protein [Bacillus thuringiensis]MRD45502.1 hypothetical protein [Bacillus thuringiensis]
MGFFEIFLAVLAVLGVIAVGCVIATALTVGYLALTDGLRTKYENIMMVVDGVALFLLIALAITCMAYFGQ